MNKKITTEKRRARSYTERRETEGGIGNGLGHGSGREIRIWIRIGFGGIGLKP